MSDIFSRISRTLGMVNGGASPDFMGPLQPPVQGPPMPTTLDKIQGGYQKVSQTPGFNNALMRLGTTLLANREQGGGIGQGLSAGLSGAESEIDRARQIEAQKASATLEYQKYLTNLALEKQKQALAEKQFGFDQSRVARDFDLREKQYNLDLIRQERQDKLDALTYAEKIGQIEAKEAERQAKIIEDQYKSGEAITSGELAIQQIDDLLKHPGFTGAVGSGFQKSIPFYGAGDESKPGGGFTQGSDAASFTERLKQLKGGAFLQAYQLLKGGGAIGVKEGEKAEASITRMSLATDEKEFRKAANEYKSIIQNAVNVEREKAKAKGIAPKGAPENNMTPMPNDYKSKYGLE